MKRILAVLTLVILVATPLAAQDDGGTISLAFIDMSRVARESIIGQESQARFEEFMQSTMNELQQEGQALQREQADLENQQSVLSEAAFAARRNDLQQRMLAFRQRQEEANRQAQQMQAEETQRFAQQAGPIIEQICLERGYTLVFDIATEGLWYHDAALDITPLVVQRLNAATSARPQPEDTAQ